MQRITYHNGIEIVVTTPRDRRRWAMLLLTAFCFWGWISSILFGGKDHRGCSMPTSETIWVAAGGEG